MEASCCEMLPSLPSVILAGPLSVAVKEHRSSPRRPPALPAEKLWSQITKRPSLCCRFATLLRKTSAKLKTRNPASAWLLTATLAEVKALFGLHAFRGRRPESQYTVCKGFPCSRLHTLESHLWKLQARHCGGVFFSKTNCVDGAVDCKACRSKA